MSSGCLRCPCATPPDTDRAAPSARLLLATEVPHIARRLRAAARDAGALLEPWRTNVATVLELVRGDVEEVLTTAVRRLSDVEAQDVRALTVEAGTADQDLLGRMLTAPSLATAGARIEHRWLSRLLEQETQTFHAEYQPIVDLADGRVVGHEALLRATDPEGRRVMPVDIFRAAARAGWTTALDRVGRTTAFRCAGSWLGGELLFVNFLPTSIYRPEVCLTSTEQAASLAGIPLSQVVFEVSEGQEIEDVDHLAGVFDHYRAKGARTALDDLGTGWSSLSLLVRLRPDVVKLAREVVQGLPEPAATSVVRAAVDITHSYGGLVLAEGIETPQQREAATALGVDLGQGWLFGRPQRRDSAEGTATSPVAIPLVCGPPASHAAGPPAALDAAPPAALDAVPPGPAAAPAPAPPSGATGPGGAPELDELLGRAVAASASGVIITDARQPDQPIVYVNEAVETLSGYTGAELLGRNCRVLQGPGTDPAARAVLRRAISREEPVSTRLLNQRPDGTTWWNELHLTPVRGSGGTVTHWFGFQLDATAQVEAEHALVHRAAHDDLTGLVNRAHLVRTLEGLCRRARSAERAVAVLFMDLDGFKALNDEHGHRLGDATLVEVAQRLRGQLRSTDVLGRHGGDEFVAVLADLRPDVARRVAADVAAALTQALEQPLLVGHQEVVVGVSTGVALYPEDGRTAEELLHVADAAMYRRKSVRRDGRAQRSAEDVVVR